VGRSTLNPPSIALILAFWEWFGSIPFQSLAGSTAS